MPLDPNKPLEREQRNIARKEWEDKVKHAEPTFAWKGTITDRGFSCKYADGKFEPGLRESASPNFEALQLHLSHEGAQNVRLVYWVKFLPGFDNPDASKLVNTMGMALLGWSCKFAVGQEVSVYNWRNEGGYVQWGIKADA